MPKLSAGAHKNLSANFEAFSKDVDQLLAKHNLNDFKLKFHFEEGGGPPPTPCDPPKKWQRVCTPHGVCGWRCR